MIININLIILFLLTIANFNLIAQRQLSSQIIQEDVTECGTELSQAQVELMNRTRTLRQNMDISKNNLRAAPLVLQITAYIIRESNTSLLTDNDITVDQVNESISQVNERFAQVGISFVGTVKYIYESTGSDNIYPALVSNSTIAETLLTNNQTANSINVYFVKELKKEKDDGSIIDICGNATLPGNSFKRIFIDTSSFYDTGGEAGVINSCALNGSSLAHEIGHYFFLYHTHQGIDADKGIIADELPNGSNCGPLVGDEICDTPADPNLSDCVNKADCKYVSSADCPAAYSPDTANVMSSSEKKCRTNFSKGQIERMIKSLILDRPELLDSSVDCPVFTGYNDMHKHNFGTPLETTEASGTIVSEATVEGESILDANDGANVIYSAGNYISLYPSFEAEYTSTFLAHIEGCEPDTNLKQVIQFL